MKLFDIFEAEIATKNVSVALPKIASYLARKLGVKLLRVPGVEHFHNSDGNGYGVRYIVSGGTRCFRINWNTEGSVGQIASIHSFDIFNGTSHDPTFTIHTKGINFAHALPMVVAIARSPALGRHYMFPVDPKLALTEGVVTEVDKPNAFKEALKVKCPLCKAEPGKGCVGVSGWRKGKQLSTLHNERLRAAGFGTQITESIVGKNVSVTFTHDDKHRGSIVDAVRIRAKDDKDARRIFDEEFSKNYKNPKITRILFHYPMKPMKEALNEAHRDDFTAEEALTDFLKQLAQGKTMTRSDFIGQYHIVNAGIFDTVFNNFKDKFRIEQKRVALASNTKLEALKDSILSKAGIVEVTKGGTKEIYLKGAQEEQVEKEAGDRVPYEDTLEHLEGLVVALIKGSTNALFVAGKGGTGKTQTVERVLHAAGLSDGKGYFKNSGSASASGVYTLLYHHRNDIILFDDSDGALRDTDARNLIKAATDTKKVRKLVWNKKSSFIFNPEEEDPEAYEDDLGMAPQYFDFKGRIIFISNLSLDQLDPDGALRTRAFVINVDPTDEELVSHMGKILMDIKLEDGLVLDKAAREHVLEVVKTSKRKGAVSLRMLVRALNLAASGAPNWA